MDFSQQIAKFEVNFCQNQTSYEHKIWGSQKTRCAKCTHNITTAENLPDLYYACSKYRRNTQHDIFLWPISAQNKSKTSL